MDYRLELVLWVLLSIILYVGWWNFRHYVVEQERWRIGAWLKPWLQKPLAEVGLECGAILYYLGIPFAALIRGSALPRFMGLSNLDWVYGGANALILGLTFSVLLGLLEVYLLRMGQRQGFTIKEEGSFFHWGKEALLLQVHWAFYRALAMVWLGVKWGTIMGLVLPVAEWLLTPQGRMFHKDVKVAFRLVNAGGLAVTSAIVFLYSRNLFFTFLIHWLAGWGIGKVRNSM